MARGAGMRRRAPRGILPRARVLRSRGAGKPCGMKLNSLTGAGLSFMFQINPRSASVRANHRWGRFVGKNDRPKLDR